MLTSARKIRKFIFDLRSMSFSDSTALKALIALVEDIEARDMAVCIVGPPKGLLILMPHARIGKKFRNVPLFDDLSELKFSNWISDPSPHLALAVGPPGEVPKLENGAAVHANAVAPAAADGHATTSTA